jgi:histidine triad (HIT) family protein
MEECIFCKIAKGHISAKKIYENENFFSIPDKSPAAKGHSLVISKRHFNTILDLNSTLGPELLDCIKQTAIKLMKENNSKGFNVLNNNFEAAGQIVNHVHFHILPRKKGDGLRGFYLERKG